MTASPKASSPPERVPLVLGRYEIIARIGQGGMGQVYLARVRAQGAFERLFAVKVMNDLGTKSKFVEALLNEARIACRIQHRNVVGIIDIGEHARGPYLVMEYIEGCTFAELQNRWRDSRPPRLVIPMIIDALYGLHAVHSLKDDTGTPLHLVHRDVSPQNFLIGVDGACRVTDFGIARARALLNKEPRVVPSGSPPMRPLDDPHTFVGKPAYMSPEQVRGEAIDHRSDIFSTGVVLWNALTGKRLFHDASPHASMFHVLKRKIPRPSTVGLKPPPRFDALVMKALQRNPDKRFQSAEEMAVELREVAIASQELGAPSEISEWLTHAFGADLETRRRLIQQASDRANRPRLEEDANQSSLITLSLPWLDESPKNLRDADDSLSVGELSTELGSVSGERALSRTPSDISRPHSEELWPPPRPARRRGVLATLAVLLIGAIGSALWFGFLEAPRSSATASSPGRPAAETTNPSPAPTALPTKAQATGPQAAESSPSSAAQEADLEPQRPRTGTESLRSPRRSPRPRAAETARPESPGKTAAPPPEKPEGRSPERSAPKPEPREPKIEDNPYLHQN